MLQHDPTERPSATELPKLYKLLKQIDATTEQLLGKLLSHFVTTSRINIGANVQDEDDDDDFLLLDDEDKFL